MVTYDEYYDHFFGEMPLGTTLTVDKDGGPYTGQLIFKSKYFITLQLPYYREGFSMADFYIGHSSFRIEGREMTEEDEKYMPRNALRGELAGLVDEELEPEAEELEELE